MFWACAHASTQKSFFVQSNWYNKVAQQKVHSCRYRLTHAISRKTYNEMMSCKHSVKINKWKKRKYQLGKIPNEKKTKTRKHFVNIALEWNQSIFIVATTANHAQQDTHLFNNNNNAMMMKKWCKNTCFTHKVNSIVLLLVIRFVWDKKKKKQVLTMVSLPCFYMHKTEYYLLLRYFWFSESLYMLHRTILHSLTPALSETNVEYNVVVFQFGFAFHSFSLANSQHIAIFSTRKAPLPSFPRISVFHPFSSPAKAFQQ